MMTELLDPTPAEVTPQPLTPVERWKRERDHLFNPTPPGPPPKTRREREQRNQQPKPLLLHADELIRETADAIWLRPESDRVEIADRVSVGVYSDPTGDTVIDERRRHLREAVQRLIIDPWRSERWRTLLAATNSAFRDAGMPTAPFVPQSFPTSETGLWLAERNMMAGYCSVSVEGRMETLGQLNPKALARLAESFDNVNNHFQQRVGNVATTFAHYSGDHT